MFMDCVVSVACDSRMQKRRRRILKQRFNEKWASSLRRKQVRVLFWCTAHSCLAPPNHSALRRRWLRGRNRRGGATITVRARKCRPERPLCVGSIPAADGPTGLSISSSGIVCRGRNDRRGCRNDCRRVQTGPKRCACTSMTSRVC